MVSSILVAKGRFCDAIALEAFPVIPGTMEISEARLEDSEGVISGLAVSWSSPQIILGRLSCSSIMVPSAPLKMIC